MRQENQRFYLPWRDIFGNMKEGCLPFMDVRVDRSDQVLTTTVYRKPTHTERYLAFDSHHPLSVKHSVASSLYNRAAVVIKDQTQLSSEIAHIQSVLQLNGYPKRFSQTSNTRKQATSINNVKRKGFVSLPFVDGTTQAIRRILTRLDIRVAVKSGSWKWALQHSKRTLCQRQE